jgi:hypothetical protein
LWIAINLLHYCHVSLENPPKCHRGVDCAR